jgi:hypothetical protein
MAMESSFVALDSSSLAGAAYDARSELMVVQFRDGTAYEYSEVPADIFDGLISAASHGRYFDETVRPSFRYRRLS